MNSSIASPVPLIPRTSLFGLATRQSGTISPSAQFLGWIAPVDGVPNIWTAPVGAPEAARPLTRDTGRGIARYRWTYDDRFLLYTQDKDGDELFHIYAVPAQGGEPRDLTPFDGAQCEIVALSRKRRGEVLVSSNARNPGYSDLLVVDLSSGETTTIEVNDRFAGFLCDDDFRPRIAREVRDDGGVDFHRRVGNEWICFHSVGPDDAATTWPSSIEPDGTTLYIVDSSGRNTAALFAHDLDSDERILLGEDMRADVMETIDDLITHRPLVYAVDYTMHERHVLDESMASTVAFLDSQGLGDWMLTSRSEDDNWWTIGSHSDVSPGECHLLDRAAMQLTHLYSTRPELKDFQLARQYPTVIRARDGLAMVSYLSLPPSADRGGIEAGLAEPLPMVLLVHGGPWARDFFGYNPEVQWLANRGYAVLSVNFRGSTGFGKRHLVAANGEWGGKMDEDLDDAVAWAIHQGLADPTRIAIMGTSYGGYAVLSALTTRPEKFACGIDIVGPANLETLIGAIPPWWESERAMIYRAVGNPETEEGRQFLKDKSPITHAHRIVRPLLIGQGANDPRVRQDEADQIAAALRANGGTPNYLLYPDEGHGFIRPANDLSFQTVAEAFLAAYLGGRAEPANPTEVAGTSLQIIDGAPWLKELHQQMGLAAK